MLKKLFRVAFTLVGGIVGYGAFLLTKYLLSISNVNNNMDNFSDLQNFGIASVFIVIMGIIFFKLTPALNQQSKKVASNIETDLQSISANEIVTGIAGLVIGLIVAFLISQVYNLIKIPFIPVVLSAITYLILGYIGVVVVTKKGKEFLPTLNANLKGHSGGLKYKDKSEQGIPKILDTSVIIDGRISGIMKTGFVEGPIVIPEFVLVELRHVADSSDGLKRNRGRRGLDVLNKIQEEYGIEIYNTNKEKSLDEIPEVDVKLLKLAQIMNGKVVTNDYNLNKVAAIKGVEVLNINELANTLKPVVLPGEEMNLFLVKEGKENGQAVAYLDDGTMIVVEEGRKYIGKSINVTVSSVLQTSAGRMIFGKPSKK